MPDGWEMRRVWVCHHGPLRFFAASRSDLIAMKVLTGRPQDLEDLDAMRVTQEDVVFVRDYLSRLKSKGTTETEINDAKELLDELEVHAL